MGAPATAGAAGTAQVMARGGRVPLQTFIVSFAVQEVLVSQRELVPGLEFALAHDTPEALLVEDLVTHAHHHVVLADGLEALRALDAEQPANTQTGSECHGGGLARHNVYSLDLSVYIYIFE